MPFPQNLTGTNKTPSQKQRVRIKFYTHKVSELLMKGYNAYEIGQRLRPGKSFSWVYKCIRRIHLTLNQQIEANADTYLKFMEAKYGKIEVEMWEAWEASKKDHKGNPRQPNIQYMDRILLAMEALRKLRGVDKQIEKNQQNSAEKENVLDWDSITKGRQLSSVTVNVNNNTVANSTTNNLAVAPSIESPTEKLKLELKNRMEELERRTIENQRKKEFESSTSLCEDVPSVPPPLIYVEQKDVEKATPQSKEFGALSSNLLRSDKDTQMVPHPKILKEEWTQDSKCVKPFKCIACSKPKLCMLLPDPIILHNDPNASKAGCVAISAWCRPCYVYRDYMTLN